MLPFTVNPDLGERPNDAWLGCFVLFSDGTEPHGTPDDDSAKISKSGDLCIAEDGMRKSRKRCGEKS